VIVGKRECLERIQKNPMARAMRLDKLTLAGFEATLLEYIDEEKAIKNIPTLRMLLQKPEELRKRANKLAKKLEREIKNAHINVMADSSRAGGGALPEVDLPTCVVSIKSDIISVNEVEERLRKGSPPIISRIKEDSLIIDVRTIRDKDLEGLVKGIRSALSEEGL
jgi:L-seryl-tRNA(Ser) seleniumtransferase